MRVEHAIREISKSGVVGQSKSTNFNLPELRSSLKIDILIGSETLYITTIAFFSDYQYTMLSYDSFTM